MFRSPFEMVFLGKSTSHSATIYIENKFEDIGKKGPIGLILIKLDEHAFMGFLFLFFLAHKENDRRQILLLPSLCMSRQKK
jgi:hypothetical protein